MVNVFIAHSGSDRDRVLKIADYLEQKETENGIALPYADYEGRHANVLVLKNTNNKWKKEARKLIGQAQVVLFVQGEKSAASENIRWEIETAIAMNKIVMVYQLDKYEFPSWMIKKDSFTGRDKPVSQVYPLQRIKERIDRFDLGEYNIFSQDGREQQNMDAYKNELFEQYKLYQQTSETLVERRQSVNSFYISVNAALVTFLGAIAGFVAMPTKLVVLIAISMAGFIIDVSWLKILDAYGALNASKMKVINLIEKQLPLKLYDVEWEIMSDKMNSKKYVSFTDSEKRIPIIFNILYAAVIIGSSCLCAFYWWF